MTFNLARYSTLLAFGGLILGLTFTVFLMIIGRTVLVPIILAVMIWWLINDITDIIHRRKLGRFQIPRPLAMLLGLVLLIIFSVWVSAVFYFEIDQFVAQSGDHLENVIVLLEGIPAWVWRGLSISKSGNAESVIAAFSVYLADRLSLYATSIAAGLANVVTQALLVLLYVVFLLWEQNTFSMKLQTMIPNSARRSEVQAVLDSIQTNIQTYVTVKTFVSTATAMVAYIIMWLFELDHAIVWAIVTFALNFIPNIGSIAATLFPTVTALVQFGKFFDAFTLFLALTAVQATIGSIIEPRLMGNRLNISPFVVLVCLAVFGAIWGIIGMILSVPLTMILIIVLGHFPSTRPLAVLLSENGLICEVEPIDEPEQIVVSQQVST